MKIAVIGTSNSVLKSGYFETYKALEYPHQVDLFAIGGTIISYASFALEYYAILEKYDLIITEFSTNDSHRYIKNIVSLEYLYQYIYDVFATISCSGKKHINLLLGHPNVEKGNEVFGIYRDLSKKFHVENIEAHEIITSLVKDKKELWQDEDHYHSHIIREIAYVLKQKRKKITQANNDNLNPTTKQQDISPIRKFYIKTFSNTNKTKQKGTSLYTFPTLMIEKDFSISIKQNHAQFEGFFYQATPFVGNVSMIIDSMIYDCDLFKAATGFFYHYQTKGQENLLITNNQLTICNGKITINEENVFTGLEYNKRPFGLVGITFSTKEKNKQYPPFSFAPATEYYTELKDYTKIFSVVQSCIHSLTILEKITDPDFLFTVAECIQNDTISLPIYAKACILSQYTNPYFLSKYIEKLLALKKFDELEKIVNVIPEKQNTILTTLLAQYKIEQEQYQKAEQILLNEQEKNPYNLSIIHLLATIYLKKEEYTLAEKYLTQCRQINTENLTYINELLFCYIKLQKQDFIQNLLKELEEYVRQCAAIQYITDFSTLEKSMHLLTKENCGTFYPFVQFLIQRNFNLLN